MKPKNVPWEELLFSGRRKKTIDWGAGKELCQINVFNSVLQRHNSQLLLGKIFQQSRHTNYVDTKLIVPHLTQIYNQGRKERLIPSFIQ